MLKLLRSVGLNRKKFFFSSLTIASGFFSLKYNENEENQPLVNTLKHLVRFKTITGHQLECKELLDWVSFQLKDLPVYIERFESNGFPIQLITTQPHRSPKIWLVCHIDVVPCTENLFHATIEDSNLQ
jgi:acetylornithine deacetylase/succinyl-diaminopimelate desuccinylase-like protein